VTAPIPLFASVGTTALALPSLTVTDDEAATIARLRQKLITDRVALELLDAYYNGEQIVRDLKISVPPELRGLHTVIGWPKIGVDALEERLDIDSWRYSDGIADSDDDLNAMWTANDGDVESQLGHVDSFVFGSAYGVVGAADGDGDLPVLTIESPLHMTCDWDARTHRITAALRDWSRPDSGPSVTLYGPGTRLVAHEDGSGAGWVVDDRSEDDTDEVLVERLTNRSRAADRSGRSEITSEIRSITDAACRTLLGLEVAREFFSAPQRYILGASESAFQAADGTAKSAWQTYVGRVLALEADDDGNLPQVGQFAAYDPSVYTRIIDMYARIMASQIGLPPHYLGYTTDNPASADAIRSAEARLVKRAERKQRLFGRSWARIMRLMLLVRDGKLPASADRIEPVWRNAATPTIGAMSDAATKLIGAGVLPATSDVTLEMVGLTAAQQRRVAADRARAGGLAALDEIVAQSRTQVGPGGVAAR
jgi:hypothetical protein